MVGRLLGHGRGVRHDQEMYQLDLDRWKRAEARRREEEALASGLEPAAIDLAAARRARRGN